MFPPSLQKNIRELDRQISLLETECEHMEAKKKETSPTGKTSPKTIRESPNKPFVTGPCGSASSYSPKMPVLPPVVPKIYSASCAHFRTIKEKKFLTDSQNRQNCFEDVKSLENIEKTTSSEEIKKVCPPENSYHAGTNDSRVEKPNSSCDKRHRPINSIKEVSESSDEHVSFYTRASKKSSETSKQQTWNVSHSEKVSTDIQAKAKSPRTEAQNRPKSKLSTDEESNRNKYFDEHRSERSVAPRKSSIRRRLRSARTKKNLANDIPLDVNMTKALHEKEIQCMLWNEEMEKGEFLDNLNQSIRTLHLLIGELKMKSSRGRRDDVLNDMQNTLMKISKIKSMNTVYNPLLMLESLKRNDIKLLEGEGKVLDLKKTLLGVKQFCQELNDEKTALTEEISAKNRALVTFKSKEKEYLSLISSLKFNLEKLKEEAEEGARAKRDLNILKTKFQEETKVIEALKKSHEKMQELIENYVLENDKLKAQVKITKLETQKFNVLLAGKEVEISTYKKEIDSFQKQITEQLSLLRSKATENELEYTMETINNQTNMFKSEQVHPSETTIDKEDFNDNPTLDSTETTSSSSIKTQTKDQSKESVNFLESGNRVGFPELKTQPKMTEETEKRKDAGCKVNGSESEVNAGRQYGLQRVLSSSKNLRSSINELLEDIRRETTEKHWPDLTNSCPSSSQTTLISITSDDASEGS